MTHTRQLAEFAAGITMEKLPAEVVRKARLCVLDYIANVFGSLRLEAVQGIVPWIRALGGSGDAAALGCGFRTGIMQAAFLNGVTAEAIEAQDGLRFGGNHPGAAVIPAALALAESRGMGGKPFLEAVVAGYEVANRCAAAVHPLHTLSGFLPTGTCGTFGAACAAARLLGLDAAGTLHALGIAGTLAPLSMAEQLMGGFTAKIVQGGQAAACGIQAAGLARAGLTGCDRILEGSELKGGFTQITVRGEPAIERLTDRLGEHYSLLDLYFKPFPACRHTHGAAQAVLELRHEAKFAPDQVDAVEVHTYGMAQLAVGKTVPAGGTFVSAQFSLPFVVAACLLDGRLGPAQLREERLADPALLALSQRVTVLLDPELNRLYPEKTATRVEVTLQDGRRLARQVDIPRGDPRAPMEEGELVDKLRRFAERCDPARIDQAARLILELEKIEDIRELTAVLL